MAGGDQKLYTLGVSIMELFVVPAKHLQDLKQALAPLPE